MSRFNPVEAPATLISRIVRFDVYTLHLARNHSTRNSRDSTGFTICNSNESAIVSKKLTTLPIYGVFRSKGGKCYTFQKEKTRRISIDRKFTCFCDKIKSRDRKNCVWPKVSNLIPIEWKSKVSIRIHNDRSSPLTESSPPLSHVDKASGRQVGIKSSVPVETRQLVISAVTPSAWILEHELIGSEPACSMIAQPTTHNAFGPSKKCPRERTGCLLDRSNYRWDWLA